MDSKYSISPLVEAQARAAVYPLYSSTLPSNLSSLLLDNLRTSLVQSEGALCTNYPYMQTTYLTCLRPIKIRALHSQYPRLIWESLRLQNQFLNKATLIPASHFPFRIVSKGFKCLGVEIKLAFSSLFTEILAFYLKNLKNTWLDG